jgi:hypothetical protein
MATKQKLKQYSVSLDPTKLMGANISRYSDGYSYANVSFKMSDKERMSVSYEWQGSDIPEFAMNVMDIMQSLGGKEKASLSVEDADLLDRFGNMLIDTAAKAKKDKEEKDDKKKNFPFNKKKDMKDGDEEEDEDMKKKKDDKKKKK